MFKPDPPFNRILFIFYLLSQMLGGLIGALLGFMITKTGGELYIIGGQGQSYKYLGQAIVIELLGSFLFILIFLI